MNRVGLYLEAASATVWFRAGGVIVLTCMSKGLLWPQCGKRKSKPIRSPELYSRPLRVSGHAGFSAWLLSLSHMHLRFLHGFAGLDGSIRFRTE